eukprot:2551309-Alexandrium_andersonii.AAC.1
MDHAGTAAESWRGARHSVVGGYQRAGGPWRGRGSLSGNGRRPVRSRSSGWAAPGTEHIWAHGPRERRACPTTGGGT